MPEKKLKDATRQYLKYLHSSGSTDNSLKIFRYLLKRFEKHVGADRIVTTITDSELQAYYHSDSVLKTSKGQPAQENTIRRR